MILLEDAYYNIEGSIEQIRDIKDNIYYDEKELEYINSRIYQINGFKKKYGKTIKEIIEYKDKIKNQYEELVNSSEIIENLKKEKSKLKEELKIEGEKLHNERCKIAQRIRDKNKK